MSSLPKLLSDRIEAVAGVDAELRAATKPQFGHFQCNVAMRLAKTEGKPPREIAQRIVDEVELDDICEPPEVAGPGFINLRLKNSVLAGTASEVLRDPDRGIPKTDRPQTVVIDYSAPNVAKQMHVGNLRSTIIGDCFNRVLTALGHAVIPQNHIGDWGTQFGMLVEKIITEDTKVDELDLADAEALYQRANAHFRADTAFANRARDRVVALQAGDPETARIWKQLIEVSLSGFNATYARMRVLLTDADLAGESTYNEDLPRVAEDLQKSGAAVVDDGALVAFIDGANAPLMVRKRDGGYGYGTTDLAAVRRRVSVFHADRLIYVVGAPQAFHFEQVFAVARKAGYLPADVSTEFVGFGQVLGPDGKRFSTRDGTAVTLNYLLDEAESQAAPAIALAAIKYSDLSNGLQKDYVFDIDKMVQTTGDTGPYLQYAHARASQVLRRAEAEGLAAPERIALVDDPAEQTLALLLSKFGEVVAEVGNTLQPHKLCAYLYELAGALSVFYERCPVLRSEGEVRASRLGLCRATQQVLASGLDLLGIEAPARM